ncbi:nuclear pore complex protein Nup205-like [Drosophila gunungcola]|uniref:nuclear pore complex protein Nup205-like n=1 Tax=Drosophila gunungcola TaxID=103775 RepID=UPI0022DFB260|nr:nuclear pore complex protein Nup205-like [Drosophila gunungcola]
MLALACLDMISELEAVSTLCDFVAMRGYLKHMLDSLGKSTRGRCAASCSLCRTNLRPLYVYESRMAFLTRMANTGVGARLLLAERALGVLSNMRVYDLQPDLKASELKRNEPPTFLRPSTSVSVPSCCRHWPSAMPLSTRWGDAAHGHTVMDLGHLQQLAAITNLFARTNTHEVTALEDSLDVENDLELRNRLGRLQQLMIVVFGRFSARAPKRCASSSSLDIAANLSLYCRNAVTSHVKDSMTSKFLLTTMINDVTPLTGKMDSKKLTAVMHTILNQLKGSIGYYLSQKSITDNLLQQRASLPNISFGPNGKQSYLDLSQRHNEKRSELMQAVFIAEQNLYLLWIHLDFYLRNAVVYANENRNAINESLLDNGNGNVSVLNASQDEILQLKQLLISTFNETFCTQLITASEDYATKCRGFNASLLRRIKALVQFAPVTANGDNSTFIS